MKYLTIEAHCLSEIEDSIGPDFGVSIADRTDEPWAVTFAGPAQGLRDMYYTHWGDDAPMPEFDKEKTDD